MPKTIPALAALPCRIGRGVFSNEREFTVSIDGKDSHVGLGDVHYFWNSRSGTLRASEPAGDDEIDGFVAAQVLKVEGTRALVEVPDANVIWVGTDAIVERPTEVRFDVPL
jgi:hypothetical protein